LAKSGQDLVRELARVSSISGARGELLFSVHSDWFAVPWDA
jgi:hypothetical protein